MIMNRLPKMAIAILAAGTLLLASCACPGPEPTPKPAPKPKTYSAPPAMMIDTGKEYTATIETERGNMVLELFASDVPNTVNSFVFLANDGFYDGVTFHRVVPGFVAQGGDPTGTGRGDPGYSFADEWPIPVQIPTAASFSLPLLPSTALTASTRYSVSSLMGWMSWSRLSRVMSSYG